MNRKEFIRNSGRWVILGAIGIFTAYLATNKRIVKESECKVSTGCNNCNKFTKCSLPQADKQRNDGEKS
jgi:hypothetical protein